MLIASDARSAKWMCRNSPDKIENQNRREEKKRRKRKKEIGTKIQPIWNIFSVFFSLFFSFNPDLLVFSLFESRSLRI